MTIDQSTNVEDDSHRNLMNAIDVVYRSIDEAKN